MFPAMPYPAYANMTDADMKTLYAFFMEGVPPVRRVNSAHELTWPINMSWILSAGLAVWDALFVDVDPFTPNPDYGGQWNRGAYLVEGLGHCGSCHTPRGLFFQEKALDSTDPDFLSGGELDHWSAPNLRGDGGDGLGDWSDEDIVGFLKTGRASMSSAFGTMIDVVNYSTQYLTDHDSRATAVYLKSLPTGVRDSTSYQENPDTFAQLSTPGPKSVPEQIYIRRCSGCHALDGNGRGQSIPPLAGNSAILDVNPASLINATLNGSQRLVVNGLPDPYRMVPFRESLKDEEIAQVLTFIRGAWGNNAAPVRADDVAAVRKDTDPASNAVVILRMR